MALEAVIQAGQPLINQRLSGCFIIFENHRSRDNCVRMFQKYRQGMFDFKENDYTYLLKYVPVEVRETNRPELICWENLHGVLKGGLSRYLTTIWVNLLMAILSAGYIFALKYAQIEDGDCYKYTSYNSIDLFDKNKQQCFCSALDFGSFIQDRRCAYFITQYPILFLVTLIYCFLVQKLMNFFHNSMTIEKLVFHDKSYHKNFVFKQILSTLLL